MHLNKLKYGLIMALSLLSLGIMAKTKLFSGRPAASNPQYIKWLEDNSMLKKSYDLTLKKAGQRHAWQSEIVFPNANKVLERGGAVMFTAYPASTITKSGQSFLSFYGDQDLWSAFSQIGIQILHTNPLKLSGGIVDGKYTQTIDGYFDRIQLQVAPEFGTDKEYKIMAAMAQTHGGEILDDLVPSHSGKGADFLLATMAYKNYAGIYKMIEIDSKDWEQLPLVPKSSQSAMLSENEVELFQNKGYLPRGEMIKSFIGGWSTTHPIQGVDRKTRRWIYFHAFFPGQPSYNWESETTSATQINFGDIAHSFDELGAKSFRLDATPFVGLPVNPTQSHQLVLGTLGRVGQMIRQHGGWSYQELNVSFEELADYLRLTSEFFYDFFTRPAVEHAALTGNTNLLVLMHQQLKKYNISPGRLIHDMQNHDEITYDMPQLLRNTEEKVLFEGESQTFGSIRQKVLSQMQNVGVNKSNKLFGNGLATTMVGLLAARFQADEFSKITPQIKEKIQKGHFLLALFNGMQPGIFGVSGWDLVGAFPIGPQGLEKLIGEKDTRWLNRGSYDLLNKNPSVTQSQFGIPLAPTLYQGLSQQLQDPNSFVSQIKGLVQIRNKYKIQLARFIDVIPNSNNSIFVMLNELPSKKQYELMILNFSDQEVSNIEINLGHVQDSEFQTNKSKLKSETLELLTNDSSLKVERGFLQTNLKALDGKIILLSLQD